MLSRPVPPRSRPRSSPSGWTRPSTIVHNLERGRRLYGGRPLLTAGSRAVSYAEFAGLVEGAAARLAAAGLRPGDRLAVCLPGCTGSTITRTCRSCVHCWLQITRIWVLSL